MFEDFYRVISRAESDGRHIWQVGFNLQHEIYGVHFPGTPITPGACQVEMLRQMAEAICGSPVFMAGIRTIKYLQVIDPIACPEVTLEETFSSPDEDGLIRCNALIKASDKTLTKAVIDFKL